MADEVAIQEIAKMLNSTPLDERMAAAGVPLSNRVIDNRGVADTSTISEIILAMMRRQADPYGSAGTYKDSQIRSTPLAAAAGIRSIPGR